MTKALLIKSQLDKNGGEVGKWNNFNNATSYIQGIHTGKILENLSADKLGSLISGVPTPWARAKLFKFAFDAITSQNRSIESEGLLQFYNLLCAEWKGLIAVIALFPDRVRFSNPVTMDVRKDNFDVAAAFGRMLFDDKDIWCNQDELDKDPDAQPFIQLIYYRNHLVGGTSPLTGCFTGVDYRNLGDDASDIPWYKNGKFEDPDRYLSLEQVQKVYLFVKNMAEHLFPNQDDKDWFCFEEKINSQRGEKAKIEVAGFRGIAKKWMEALAYKGNGKLKDVGPVAQYNNLSVPFRDLFKCEVPVYMKPDFTFTYKNDNNYEKLGNIQDLLSKDKYVVGWVEEADEINKLSDAPIYYLKVPELKDGSCSYFSLPLSVQGLDIFKNSLSSLLGYTQGDDKTKLTAEINDANQLAVSLVVEIDGVAITLNKREYEIRWMLSSGKVILWPNFVSKEWNKYYLYTEFTSDANETFIPFFKSNGNILKNIKNEILTSDYVCPPEEDKQVDVSKLVAYPHEERSTELAKYDIIRTDKPIAGTLVKIKEAGITCGAGVLMLRSDMIKDLSEVDCPGSAVIGMDFGSNNTCVYYNADHHGAKPVQFKNYRTLIVGKENNNHRAIAENSELLFFSNYESDNGQLKSWLHEHDSRYTRYTSNEEISGGVPVNRPNVMVKEMDEYTIKTQAGDLHYNMKWLNDQKGLNKKRAFLRSVWLETCAFLYQNRIKPSQINWSYPGSMMEADVNDLQRIFDDLCSNTPIEGARIRLNEDRITEAEAVCSFALSNDDFGLTNENMFLGIDVGGSTSDILLLAKNPNDGNKASLFRESSVRLAAGVFFNTVINSSDFREALLKFHGSRCTNVFVANINEILTAKEKAPYYLNSIFDQLKTPTDYSKFYDSIASNSQSVFTIPAFVTGLLLYYSGMLIGTTIKENNLTGIKKIDILSFGKGGRLFHWLRNATSNYTTMEYYRNCVNAGVRRICNVDLEVRYRDEIEVDNKAEVAKGLCDMKDLNKLYSDTKSDICAEEGVLFTNTQGESRELDPTEELTGAYFDNDMNYFNFAELKCFNEFFEIFIDFVSVKTKLCPRDRELREELALLPEKVVGTIIKDDEYQSAQRKAREGHDFAYHQPLVIAEGSCFLKKSLIKKVFN